MKVTLHVPVESYGFVSLEYETGGDVSADTAAEIYKEYATAFAPKPINTLPDKEWRWFMEQLCLGAIENGQEYIEQMSPFQRFAVNELKKTLKRLKAKDTTNPHTDEE